MFYTNKADTSGFVVKHNIFCGVIDWDSRYSAGWKPLPEMDHNLWFSEQGVMTYFFRDKIERFQDYQEISGLDQHSVFADPEFLDSAGGNYRTALTGPVRGIRPDGGPVGAQSLWN